jgi:PAS domain S-box-containing protein
MALRGVRSVRDSKAPVLAAAFAGTLSACLLVWYFERSLSAVLVACGTSVFLISVSLLLVWFFHRPPRPLADQQAAMAVTKLSAHLEQVRTERDEAQSDYRSIFHNSLAGIYEIDGAGRIILANPAFATMLGFESEDELERTVRNAHEEIFLDPEHRMRFSATLEDDRLEDVETEVRTKDDRRLWILESARRIDKDGAFAYCEGIVFDITPRKRATLALRRLSAQLMEVQDEERRRLARELHDSMGQLLAAIEMNLTALEDTARLDPAAKAMLRDTLEVCREASRQTRSTSHLLHPPLLEELGLAAAVREFASGYEQRSGIDVTVEVGDLGRLPQTLETSLFRFFQECLTNVHRHSGSDRATIRLSRRESGVLAEVEDFGRGIPEEVSSDVDESRAMGVGLRGLQARLEQLDGHLDIRTSTKGTIVSAFVPLDSSSPIPDEGKEIPSTTR